MNNSIQIFDGYLTITNIWLILSSISLLIITQVVLNKSSLGLKTKAVINNETLSQIYGISSSNVQEIAFVIGTILASIAGILIAYNIDLIPTMGFNLLLYGIIAMIIGGVGNTWGIIFGSLLLATAQHLGAFYFDSKWMDAIAFIILILFLVWKPLGLSGRRLKKIEI